MNIITIILYLGYGIFGIVCNVFLMQLPDLQRKAKVANLDFSAKKYFTSDWVSLCGSVCTVLLVIGLWPMIVVKYPKISDFYFIAFVSVGFIGGILGQRILGKTSGMIMNIIDQKTNIADKVEGSDAITTIQKIIKDDKQP